MTVDSKESLVIPHCGGEDVNAEAAEWAAYLHSGKDSEAGRRKFSEWLQLSEQHTETYLKIEQWWRDVGYAAMSSETLRNSVPEQQSKTNVSPFPRRNTKPERSVVRMTMAFAAGLIVAVGVWYFSLYQSGTETYYASHTGEDLAIELADGSTVTLGGSSTLVARFSRDRRYIDLMQGQAYFEVSGDSERPFIVSAHQTEVHVLGTAFDVLKSSGDVRIAVTEGKVKVVSVPQANAQTVAGQNLATTLLPGQQVFANLHGEVSQVSDFQAEQLLAWKEGRLEYVDVKLSRVIEDVNRYRDVKISLMDPALSEIRITISMPSTETDRLLSGLELTEPVSIVRTPDSIRISARQSVEQQ